MQDLAEPKSVNADKQTDSGNPLNVFKLKDKYKRPISKKSDISGSGKGIRKTRHLTYLREDKETAIFILGKIQNIQPKFKEPNLGSWANDIRLTREQDKRTHEEIRRLFIWANSHSFWQSNILCPAKLRMKWDQLEIQRASNSNGGYRSQADHNSSSTGRVVV